MKYTEKPVSIFGFNLLITSWHLFLVHHFLLAPFFALSLICLPYINKSFVMKTSYLVPRAKLLPVTFFVKWSYLLPAKTLNCHISRTMHIRIPVFTLNWHLVTSILYTNKARDFIQRNFAYLALICAVWSGRGRDGKKVTAASHIFLTSHIFAVPSSAFALRHVAGFVVSRFSQCDRFGLL